MGKETGFLELDRKDRTYTDPKERLKNYKEFTIPQAEGDLRAQASRCMNCGIPYCHNGCPVNNIIPDFNDLIYNGDWQNALESCIRPTISPNSPAASAPRRAKRAARSISMTRQ